MSERARIAVLPAPTFLFTQIQQFKNKKRGQRRAWGEEISAENGFFYSLNDAVEKLVAGLHNHNFGGHLILPRMEIGQHSAF